MSGYNCFGDQIRNLSETSIPFSFTTFRVVDRFVTCTITKISLDYRLQTSVWPDPEEELFWTLNVLALISIRNLPSTYLLSQCHKPGIHRYWESVFIVRHVCVPHVVKAEYVRYVVYDDGGDTDSPGYCQLCPLLHKPCKPIHRRRAVCAALGMKISFV